jgi:hypothetical protein
MNVNVLFGILESTAPNVRELQLFKDDAAEACIGREYPPFVFSHRFRHSIEEEVFCLLLSPFTRYYLHSPSVTQSPSVPRPLGPDKSSGWLVRLPFFGCGLAHQ